MTSKDPNTVDLKASPKSDMVIRVPSEKNRDAAVAQIKQRGGTPLFVGDDILAEIAGEELREAMLATAFLNNVELMKISNALVESLTGKLDGGVQNEEMSEVAADAASLFVLCLRRYNILDIDNIPTCGVTFSNQDNDARLRLTA